MNLPEMDGFIFKSRSPTMGLKAKVYSGMKGAPVVSKCGGFFAGKVAEKFMGYPIEEEDRLDNQKIREHFFVKLFAFASYRENPDEFMQRNKLLLQYYNQEIEFTDLDSLKEIFSRPPDEKGILDFYKKNIDMIEKQKEFTGMLQLFEDNKITSDTLKETFRILIKDKNNLEQTFFNAFPEELKMNIEKDRNYWK